MVVNTKNMPKEYIDLKDKQGSKKTFSNKFLSPKVLFALLIAVFLSHFLLLEAFPNFNDFHVPVSLTALFVIWIMFVVWLGGKLFPPEKYLKRQEVKIGISSILKAFLLVMFAVVSAIALIFLEFAFGLIWYFFQ